MKLIDGDALAEWIRKVKSEICYLAAGWEDEDSYECGAVDAFTDVLSYIEEAPDLGQAQAPMGDPEREEPKGSAEGNGKNVMSCIDGVPAGDQDPGRLRDPAADPESEEGNG